MRTALTFTMATLLAATAAPTGRAEPITFMFSGEITSVFDPDGVLTGTVTVGTPFSGEYTFESGTLDSDPRDNFGQYTNAIMSVSGTVGDIPFNGPIDSVNSILIFNSDPLAPRDDYHVGARVSFLSQPLPLGLLLADSEAMIFTNDGLPLVPPDLESLEIAKFSLGDEGFLTLGGRITELTPEPGTVLLVFVAGATALTMRRSRGHAVNLTVQEDRS